MNVPVFSGSRRTLEMLRHAGGAPGSAGFKLTGFADDGGLCRVWLRRRDPWERYLDPRFRSSVWDVRCYTWQDSAFALVAEFELATLDTLAATYRFEAPTDAIARLGANGDVVHDAVLAWAKRVLGAPAEVATEVAKPAPPPPADRAEVPLREAASSSASQSATGPMGALPAFEAEAAPSAAAPNAAPVTEPPTTGGATVTMAGLSGPAAEAPVGGATVTMAGLPAEVDADAVTPLPAPPAEAAASSVDGARQTSETQALSPVGATGTMAMSPVPAPPAVDAWDELAEVATRVATGARPIVE